MMKITNTLRELYAEQGLLPAADEDRPSAARLTRDDLHLVCFEYSGD